MIFPQEFSSGDYLFIYDYGDNNVVRFIHPTTDSENKPEDYMPDEDVIDTIGDYMLEEMEHTNGKICDESDSSFEEEHEMDDEAYYLSDDLKKKLEIIYIYGYLNHPMEQNIL